MTGKIRLFLAVALAAAVFPSCASMRQYAGNERDTVVRFANEMLDTDYGYGKQKEGEGFDCSGLAQAAYAKAGIRIPRMVKDQYAKARKITASEARPGDLVFYSTYAPGATHVGIYMGSDRFIHAPSTGKKVATVDMNNVYWKGRFVGFGSYF